MRFFFKILIFEIKSFIFFIFPGFTRIVQPKLWQHILRKTTVTKTSRGGQKSYGFATTNQIAQMANSSLETQEIAL